MTIAQMPPLLIGLVLGVVQGITEWLPISSEAMNTLILLNLGKSPAEAVYLAIWLHVGTVLSATVYFRRDVIDIIRKLPAYARSVVRRKTASGDPLITYLLIATGLTGAIGAPLLLFSLDREISLPPGAAMAIIGVFLIITGLVQRYARRAYGTRTVPRVADAILLGVVQAFTVLPGLSRSGLTVSALLFRGYQAQQAVRLSFIMSIPVVLGAGIGLNLVGGARFDIASISGIAAAFVLGLLTIGVLVRIAKTVNFWKFCVLLGALSLLPLVIQAI